VAVERRKGPCGFAAAAAFMRGLGYVVQVSSGCEVA
jgi:hypothetical protein